MFLGLPPDRRAVVTIAVLAGALWAASAEWRPLTVSLLALTGVVLVGFIALSVGRSELARRAAEAAIVQLKGTVVAVSEIDELGSPVVTTDKAPVFNAIRAACELATKARAQGPCPAIPTADAASPHAERSVDALFVAMAVVRLRLAEYRRDELARPEDAAEVASANTAVTAAIATLAAEQPGPASALDALSAGGDAIAQSVLGDEAPVVLETAGWILLAFVALLFWRLIAKRSFRAGPGHVDPALGRMPKRDRGRNKVCGRGTARGLPRGRPEERVRTGSATGRGGDPVVDRSARGARSAELARAGGEGPEDDPGDSSGFQRDRRGRSAGHRR